eukprot:scaffold1815_cov208-Amphora_coffeaeformis.AAC.10
MSLSPWNRAKRCPRFREDGWNATDLEKPLQNLHRGKYRNQTRYAWSVEESSPKPSLLHSVPHAR